MNKRDLVLNVVRKENPEYIPAGFFLHFDPQYHRGKGAIDKHLEFFNHTDMDFIKIQYELTFPRLVWIEKASDWARMPCYSLQFYEPQLKVVDGLVKAGKKDALVVITLYSAFMCAGHTAGENKLDMHLEEDPEAVKKGLEVINASLFGFADECIRLGVDGFYACSQGGEALRFSTPTVFENYIKPFDLAIMNHIHQFCEFNILHICDFHRPYDTLAQFMDYPGHVVNTGLSIGGMKLEMSDITAKFRRPFMGGMERKGILATGQEEEIEHEVLKVLKNAPAQFILAADCTVPANTPWRNLRKAISIAHNYRR